MEQILGKLNEARDILANYAPHPIPPELGTITQKDTTWVQTCLTKLEPSLDRLPLDSTYRMVSQSKFLNIVAWDWVDSKKYEAEIFDCENFAITFKTHIDWYFGLNQVGIVIDYKMGHGYNLVVFPDGKVMLFEPQTDGLFVWGTNSIYVLKGAYVLL
jgi:hypothetical protein